MQILLKTSSFTSIHIPTSTTKTQFIKPKFLNLQPKPIPCKSFSGNHKKTPPESKLFTTIPSSSFSVSTVTLEPELQPDSHGENFDWYAHWYPVMLVSDLDKRVPHAKKVIGLDIVVWWDRNDISWKVFNDVCPHRLAPLSEGRIDQWGRLQCVYHGWCFNGSGDCNFIPQAPSDGPPVQTSKKACVAVYPSTVQHDILWFWPNTDPLYKDIILKKQPPFIPEMDDPSFVNITGSRDLPYGYEVLIENLMDPAHVPYAHHGLMKIRKPKVKADREGGSPVELKVKKLDINGFIGDQNEFGSKRFIAPCTCYYESMPVIDPGYDATGSSTGTEKRRLAIIFFCIPVSPGNSRLIWAFPRNYGVWIAKVFPLFISHLITNIVLDSDLYLLHLEERKIMEIGNTNWQKACFVPTKSDAFVVGFRRWLNKYAGGQVDWKDKYSTGVLPPVPPREQLLDRYWSHVVNCHSCHAAYKGLNALEMTLQVASLAFTGIAAATKQNVNTMVAMAVICFVGSRWLAHFIYKNFHYHGYNHALR